MKLFPAALVLGSLLSPAVFAADLCHTDPNAAMNQLAQKMKVSAADLSKEAIAEKVGTFEAEIKAGKYPAELKAYMSDLGGLVLSMKEGVERASQELKIDQSNAPEFKVTRMDRDIVVQTMDALLGALNVTDLALKAKLAGKPDSEIANLPAVKQLQAQAAKLAAEAAQMAEAESKLDEAAGTRLNNLKIKLSQLSTVETCESMVARFGK